MSSESFCSLTDWKAFPKWTSYKSASQVVQFYIQTHYICRHLSKREKNISLFFQSWPPLNLADMETRDGTPFMGLTTTQDGIISSSVDLKPTKQTTTNKNKRCNSCLQQSEECTCKAPAIFVQRCKECLHFAGSPERHQVADFPAVFFIIVILDLSWNTNTNTNTKSWNERHQEHRREARHIHSYRNRAYRFVKLCFLSVFRFYVYFVYIIAWHNMIH